MLRLLCAATCLTALWATAAFAGPDLFIGDTAIYSGDTTSVRPNVLFIIDNSAGMTQVGTSQPYDPDKTYPGSYSTDALYVRTAATGGTINYNSYIDSIGSVSCASAATQLTSSGAYYGPLKKSDGSCNASQEGNYYLGNLLNYISLPPDAWAANHAYAQGDTIYPNGSTGGAFVATTGGTSGNVQPTWPSSTGSQVTDGTVTWVLSPSSILGMVQGTVNQVAAAVRNSVNVGVMVFGSNNHGGQVLKPVADISDISASGPTNFTNFTNAVNGIATLNANSQPVNESVWDAGVYYRGSNNDSQKKISSDTLAYPSPIAYSCQKSFVIVLTTGNSSDITLTKQHLTDLNADGTVGDAVDAAIYNYTTDNNSTISGVQRVSTTVVQLLTTTVPILQQAAAAGHGDYYNVWNSSQLTDALYNTMANIVQSVNTSFVAPVVPVSPENRTYSGSRVYMGFFRPIASQYWHGNLKKLGINNQNALTDQNGALATYTDGNSDGIDDIDHATLPSGAQNGSFRSTCSSFWSNDADAGSVEDGGAAQVLLDRNFSTTPRSLYTFTGTSADLTASSNAFATGNAAITNTMLGVATAADRDKLFNFINGLDAYDENNNGNTSEKRGGSGSSAGQDFFGDILHSRPLIVNYSRYTFSNANEADCSVNKSVIYVGANDGMLHAVRDCDGKELWGFIPPDMVGNLNYLAGTNHPYFADSTPSVYIYDHNNNGVIETPDSGGVNDKVVLVFGERRGGGASSAPTSGSYYALDVTNPLAPSFLWRISNSSVESGTTASASTAYAELGETWSEPKLVKMRIGSADKIVAFVGAGYDNVHEDTRFGNTQLFTNAASVNPVTDTGNGAVVSGGFTSATSLTNPKGRGVYAIEIATLDATTKVPSFANGGTKLWGYVYGGSTNETAVPPASSTNSLMKFSIVSEIAAIDSDNDGYADRLYVGDTGGRIWRFDVGDSDVTHWRGKRLFNLNAGATGVGRKFFYKPSVVMEGNYVMLFIGSGDREHPLNRDPNLIDRMYGLKDLGQSTADAKSEADLTDQTTDLIQSTTATSGASSISGIQASLASSYGWYVSLNQNAGEKVLAAPTVFNKVAYFTTYAPNTTAVVDPCQPGNLGTSRLYALDYKNASAVLNYNTANDSLLINNAMANSTPGQVLQRADRVVTLGSGIPSGIVMLITPSGSLRALIGVGGVIAGQDPKRGGAVLPLYWRQK